MKIRRVMPLEYLEAKRFYNKFGYKWNINPYDFVLIAKEKEKIIGIVRINKQNGYPILMGMLVDEAHRRQGIATKMLNYLEQHHQDKESYCIPNVNLKGFYKQFEYEAIEFEKAPVYLKKRLLFNNKSRKYSIKNKKKKIIMRKRKNKQYENLFARHSS